MEKFGRKCKEFMAEELKARFKEASGFFVTNYAGLSSPEVESLRRDLKKNSLDYLVVKNRIAKIVFDELKLEDVSAMIEGAVGIGLCGDDPIPASRILMNFIKGHENLKIKGAVLGGKLVSPDRIKEISKIPSREALIAVALAGMKSPVLGFVRALGCIMRKFVWCLDAVRKSKEKS